MQRFTPIGGSTGAPGGRIRHRAAPAVQRDFRPYRREVAVRNVLLAAALLLAGCGPRVVDDTPSCSWRCGPIAIRPGQAASNVVGQSSLSASTPASPPNATQLVPAGNPAVAGGKLFVADSTTGRVMAFSLAGGLTNGEAASFVLGAPDLFSLPGFNLTPRDFSAASVASDGTRLAVADIGFNRVLIYNTVPGSNYAAADVAVGQPSLNTAITANQYGCDNTHFFFPSSASLGGGKLVVTDTNNHRVMVWNSIPAASGTPADVVVGQPDFTSCNSNEGLTAANAGTLSAPADAWTDGSSLYVADAGNSRVLMWHGMPAFNGQPADAVLGQPNFGSATPGTAANNFSGAAGLSADASALYVADTGCTRVAVYSPIPPAGSTNATAGAVQTLGQTVNGGCVASATTTGQAFNASPVASVAGITSVGGVVYVNDAGNARILTFATPIVTNQAARNVVGQAVFTTGVGTGNIYSTAPNATGLVPDLNAVQVGTSLYLPDQGVAPRLLQYTLPVSGAVTPTAVQGVSSTTAYNIELTIPTGITGQNFAASAVATDGTNLFLSDPAGNRVLIFQPAPTVTYSSATLVVGTTALTGQSQGCTNATFFGTPQGVAVGGGKLVVADQVGSRVLVWNTIPTANGQAANLVLGQSDFVSCTANHGGTGIANRLARLTAKPDSFRFPTGVWTDGKMLLVADEGNNRVVGWNSFPNVNGQPADFALGQLNRNSRTVFNPPTPSSLRQPLSVTSNGSQIFVADTVNNRVMIWSTPPFTDGQPADSWIGQIDPTVSLAGVSPTAMARPNGVALINGQVWVMDTGNARVLIFIDTFH